MKKIKDALVCRPLSRRKTAQDLREQGLIRLPLTRSVEAGKFGLKEGKRGLTIQVKFHTRATSQGGIRSLLNYTVARQLMAMTEKEAKDCRKRGLKVDVISGLSGYEAPSFTKVVKRYEPLSLANVLERKGVVYRAGLKSVRTLRMRGGFYAKMCGSVGGGNDGDGFGGESLDFEAEVFCAAGRVPECRRFCKSLKKLLGELEIKGEKIENEGKRIKKLAQEFKERLGDDEPPVNVFLKPPYRDEQILSALRNASTQEFGDLHCGNMRYENENHVGKTKKYSDIHLLICLFFYIHVHQLNGSGDFYFGLRGRFLNFCRDNLECEQIRFCRESYFTRCINALEERNGGFENYIKAPDKPRVFLQKGDPDLLFWYKIYAEVEPCFKSVISPPDLQE